MNHPSKSLGYTIVETMIFLAVSAALFVSAMAVIGTEQARAEFRYGMNNYMGNIRDVINDISIGYYDTRGIDMSCERNGGGTMPRLTPTTSDQGTNQECVFLGRVIHFAPSGPLDGYDRGQIYRVYTVVGLRHQAQGFNTDDESVTLEQASPVLIENYLPAYVKNEALPNGIRLDESSSTGFAFAYLTNFANYTSYETSTSNVIDTLESSSRSVQYISLNDIDAFDKDISDVEDALRNVMAAPTRNEITLCFEGKNYHGDVKIGGDVTGLAEDLQIDRGRCS